MKTILIFLSLIFFSCSREQVIVPDYIPPSHTLKYVWEFTGSPQAMSVGYTNASGGDEGVSVAGNGSKTVTISNPGSYHLIVIAAHLSKIISAKASLYIDGNLSDSKTGSGNYVELKIYGSF